MNKSIKIHCVDEASVLKLAGSLATQCPSGCWVYLKGELGAGKTTFVRGVLRALGYEGNVKSPTYTLVEKYDVERATIYHFDLYRLVDPEELEFIGIRDYAATEGIGFIEWPDKGQGLLPEAQLYITFNIGDEGRDIVIEGKDAVGRDIVDKLRDE